MICFDTNIIVYIANGTLTEDIINNTPIIYPSIVQIEALGYSNIKSIEEQKVRDLLKSMTNIPLTDTIIEIAVRLRQNKKMNLGDAIVAATALENDCQLWTANTEDFEHIDELNLFNPLDKLSPDNTLKK